MSTRHLSRLILVLLTLFLAAPALGRGDAVELPEYAAARLAVAEGLIDAGVDPDTAAAQVMQLTAEDLGVLTANPLMLQRAGAGEASVIFLIILIALIVALIAAGASGFISIG